MASNDNYLESNIDDSDLHSELEPEPIVEDLTVKDSITDLYAKRKSWVWQHFILYMEGEKILGCCKHCLKTVFQSESVKGTSNHSKHLCGSCQKYKEFRKLYSISNFDQKVYCAKFAKAIICHAYPLQIIEHAELRELHIYLNPLVKHISRSTILKYCIREFDTHKAILSNELSKLPGRICFTCDVWSACTSRGYIVLTAHFIDENWTLRSKVLSFRYFPPPHNGKDIYNITVKLIDEWNLKGKIFSITIDNASANDVMVDELRKDFLESHSLPCDGKFLHVRCAAHILNLIVRDGLDIVDESVVKLRSIAKYIDWSNARLTQFEKACKSSKSGFSGRLKLDVKTRWNSTYLMLRKCLEAKVGIDRFCVLESGLPYCLTAAEWQTIQNVCDFLEVFYDVTVLFSGSEYPTSNLYFENIAYIESLLVSAHADPGDCIKKMVAPMLDKFSKCWENYTSILAIAVMLDSRYKAQIVKDMYDTLYHHDESAKKVDEAYYAFTELYTSYSGVSTTSTFSDQSDLSSTISASSVLSRPYKKTNTRKRYVASMGASRGVKFDIDSYLNSPIVPVIDGQKFDVLDYWKGQSSVYPILARMARDVLAIPITFVTSESTFSMGGRILSKFRSRLLSKNVEVLITTQSWIKGYDEPIDDSNLDVVRVVVPQVIDDEDLEIKKRFLH